MEACSIDTAVRNAVAIGADPNYMALLDNFCWCSSDEKERLGQLKEAARACFDYGILYEMPFISGKDSMFNDFKGFDEKGKPIKISVPPTLLISSISVIPDSSKIVTLDFKFAGDLLYLLGETKEEMGASEFFTMLGEAKKKDIKGNTVPIVNGKENLELYKRVHAAIKSDLIASSISLSRGGLAVALLKSAMGGKLGAEINLPDGAEYVHLFSESQGRLLVSVNPKKAKEFEKIMKGMKIMKIGTVKGNAVKILNWEEKEIGKLSVDEALEAYRSTFKNF